MSQIINTDGVNPGFPCELVDCGNSMECMAIETYFASGGALKPLLHNTSGNRETKGYHSNWEALIQIAH